MRLRCKFLIFGEQHCVSLSETHRVVKTINLEISRPLTKHVKVVGPRIFRQWYLRHANEFVALVNRLGKSPSRRELPSQQPLES